MAHLNKFPFSVTAFWLVTALVCYFNFRALETTTHWYVHTYKVLEVTNNINVALSDAQVSQRYYLLLNDQKYKKEYEDLRDLIYPVIEEARRLTHDNATTQGRIAVLHRLTDKLINKWEHTILEFENSGLSAAQESVRVNQSYETLKELQVVLKEIDNEEFALLQQREAINKEAFEDCRVCTFIAFGLSLFMFMIPLVSATRDYYETFFTKGR